MPCSRGAELPGREMPTASLQPDLLCIAAALESASSVSLFDLAAPTPGEIGRQALWALLFTSAFAIGARLLQAVSLSGALAGGALAFLLYLGGGPGAFLALVTVFLLSWATTRLGLRRKQRLGIAEKRGGRSASQVIANLGIASLLAALALSGWHAALWLLASTAALAEAAADTVSSEFGQAVGKNAYLVTTFEPVAVGSDGGVSLPGTLAGIAAAALVTAVAAATGVIEPRWIAPAAGAGVIGMFVDSFLGAGLERRGLLGNDAVNLISTGAAALLAFGFALRSL